MKHADILAQLEAIITQRRHQPAQASYVASLYAKGPRKIAQKVVEEAAELAIAAVSGEGRDNIVSEAADVLFHMMVLLAQAEIGLDEVFAELKRREGTSGHIEKASRKEKP